MSDLPSLGGRRTRRAEVSVRVRSSRRAEDRRIRGRAEDRRTDRLSEGVGETRDERLCAVGRRSSPRWTGPRAHPLPTRRTHRTRTRGPLVPHITLSATNRLCNPAPAPAPAPSTTHDRSTARTTRRCVDSVWALRRVNGTTPPFVPSRGHGGPGVCRARQSAAWAWWRSLGGTEVAVLRCCTAPLEGPPPNETAWRPALARSSTHGIVDDQALLPGQPGRNRAG